MFRFVFWLFLLIPAAAPLAFATDIRGAIVNDAGGAVANVMVVYGRLAPNAPKGRPHALAPILSARADANGRFTLLNLAPATYLLCLSAPAVLDPCHWSPSPPRVIVGSNEPPATVVIHAKSSFQLPIRLNDPSNQLAQEGKQPGAVVNFGSWAPSGAFIPARLMSSDSAGRNYVISIPYDTPIQLFAGGTAFQLQNNSIAAALPSQGAAIQVTAPSTGATPSLSFTITGIGHN